MQALSARAVIASSSSDSLAKHPRPACPKPEQKKINVKNNPPTLIIEFFDEQKNIRNINCYSNDGGNWQKSELKFENQNLIINFKEPFVPRRGRINCSLNDNGKWRWFGTQFTVKKN